jgi:glycosyltransferase involved in cell wall biosynthesis
VRIAFVTGHYLPFTGGVESHVEQIARRLAAAGDEVTVLTQSDSRQWPPRETIDGVDVRRFAVPISSRHFAVSPALWSELRHSTSEWDVIHAHGYHSVVPLLAALARSRPLVLTPHYHGTGHSPLRKLMHPPYRAAGRVILKASARVICVSAAERTLLLRHFPAATDKTIVIPNGVDLTALLGAAPFPTSTRTIISAGRLESYKNVESTIRAMALLDDSYRLIVTGDGPDRHRLEGIASELRLGEKVAFLGRIDVDTLYRWYRTADVYVSMSSNEAMPVTILELLACGARIVASNIPAHVDIRARTQGPITLVPLESKPTALADAIGEAASNSRAEEVQVPTWDDVTQRTRRVYAEVLDNG